MANRWYEDPLTTLALVLAGAGTYVLFARDETNTITGTVSDVFTRGSKVTSSTMGPNGVIVEDPLTLVGIAAVMVPGTDEDRYGLARMMRSEGADAAEIRGHVALNDLRALGWSSLHFLLTYSTASWARGRYGKQNSSYTDQDGRKYSQTRRYATSKDPYEGDLAMAAKVINDHQRGIDPTGGAIKFIDRNSMSSPEAFEAVNQSWQDDGLVAYTLPGYGDDLVLYKRG